MNQELESNKMIKALIFDLDNTLIDRQRAFKEMLKRRFEELSFDEEIIEKMIDDVLLWDDNGQVPRDIVFQRWADKYQIREIDPIKLANDWSKESGSIAFLYDDVRPTLEILKKKYKIALLSNGNIASQRRKINTIKIDDLLDYSLVSKEYEVDKPDPKIFHYVCKQLGLNCDECVYIGDNYKLDYLGALNAGLKAIWIDRSGIKEKDESTIHQIKDLLEMY